MFGFYDIFALQIIVSRCSVSYSICKRSETYSSSQTKIPLALYIYIDSYSTDPKGNCIAVEL